ncbi:protease IV, partial [Phenoliferia sp. Uapishka_3]
MADAPPAPPASNTAPTLPPRPPTGGAGSSSSTYSRFAATRTFRLARTGWAYKRAILLGVGVSYGLVKWKLEKAAAARRDAVHDKTVLLWKIYDGGIVEAKSTGSSLNYLLTSSGGSPEEPPRVMTLFEVIRAIKFIEADDRIKGLIADFSAISVPAVPSYSLGLAQLEEVQDALLELRRTKQEKMGNGPEGWRSVAWTDTFSSQGQFLLASAFDEVYTQPTGEVPLVGMGAFQSDQGGDSLQKAFALTQKTWRTGSTTPFFGRLLKWLGVEVHAEARNEYKSFVQPYIDEKLTKAQKENQIELISDLNDNLLTYIARNRFPTEGGQAGLDKVRALTQIGPFTASQAVKAGLLDGATYRQDIFDSVFDEEKGGDGAKHLKGFYHYAKTMERQVEKNQKGVIDVGVVYLLGTIGDTGEFGTAAVVKGLKEAGDDDSIGAVVLRIDSGGGGVVESDTIWAAVRDLRNKGKTVVASFANASASGGYLVSTREILLIFNWITEAEKSLGQMSMLFLLPVRSLFGLTLPWSEADLSPPTASTITGSIGVASLRPTFLSTFFDRIHITLDSYFTGSRSQDVTHPLTGAELERHRFHVDEMYADFKNRVSEGRGINPELMDLIAGGRVMTGLKAFSLTAPESLVRQIKGLDTPGIPKIPDSERIVEIDEVEPVIATSPLEAGEGGKPTVVVISVDQETSSFAPPEPSTTDVPTLEPVETPAQAEANAKAALETATSEELVVPTLTPAAVNGVYPITLGPFGRGLIDGIGGIRDSAVYACELFIANGLEGYKEEHPGVSEEEAIAALLPDAAVAKGPNGENLMQVDVRLKRFPQQKSFLQQLQEASKRGDAIDPSAVMHYLKASAATWILSMAAGVVSAEMEELGLGNARAGLGLGSTKRKGWMRAEWSGLNLR